MAPLDVAVLVTGETGTGKTQLARVIHENGRRRARRFVELNCSAIPENLLESELFGALPGAHSSATRRIEGKVAAAEGRNALPRRGRRALASGAGQAPAVPPHEGVLPARLVDLAHGRRADHRGHQQRPRRARPRAAFPQRSLLSVAGPQRPDALALGAARRHRAALAPPVCARAAIARPPRARSLAGRDPGDRGLRMAGQRSRAGARSRSRGDSRRWRGREVRRGHASLRPAGRRGIRQPSPADFSGRDAPLSGGPRAARARSGGLERGRRGAHARSRPGRTSTTSSRPSVSRVARRNERGFSTSRPRRSVGRSEALQRRDRRRGAHDGRRPSDRRAARLVASDPGAAVRVVRRRRLAPGRSPGRRSRGITSGRRTARPPS